MGEMVASARTANPYPMESKFCSQHMFSFCSVFLCFPFVYFKFCVPFDVALTAAATYCTVHAAHTLQVGSQPTFTIRSPTNGPPGNQTAHIHANPPPTSTTLRPPQNIAEVVEDALGRGGYSVVLEELEEEALALHL